MYVDFVPTAMMNKLRNDGKGYDNFFCEVPVLHRSHKRITRAVIKETVTNTNTQLARLVCYLDTGATFGIVGCTDLAVCLEPISRFNR